GFVPATAPWRRPREQDLRFCGRCPESDGSPPAYLAETTWSVKGEGACSGGVLGFVSAPVYQVPLSPALGVTGHRTVPDLSLAASGILDVINGCGSFTTSTNPGCLGAVSGTSLAAPLMAAWVALANQQSAGIKPAGFINPFIYSVGGAGATIYNDLLQVWVGAAGELIQAHVDSHHRCHRSRGVADVYRVRVAGLVVDPLGGDGTGGERHARQDVLIGAQTDHDLIGRATVHAVALVRGASGRRVEHRRGRGQHRRALEEILVGVRADHDVAGRTAVHGGAADRALGRRSSRRRRIVDREVGLLEQIVAGPGHV